MKTRNGIAPIIAAVLVLTVVSAFVFIVVTQTDFIGSTVGAGNDCSFEPYTLNGQQFSTLEEAKTTYQQLGGENWEALMKSVRLQVRDGVVNARVCEYG